MYDGEEVYQLAIPFGSHDSVLQPSVVTVEETEHQIFSFYDDCDWREEVFCWRYRRWVNVWPSL